MGDSLGQVLHSRRRARPKDGVGSARGGFTLVELLVVAAVTVALAALVFGVLTRSRQAGLRTSCLSNERQLGAAFLQYQQDSDDQLPRGTQRYAHVGRPDGEGWAGQVYPYVKSTAVFRCPDDATRPRPAAPVVSYGFNSWLPASVAVSGMPGRIPYTAQTVLLFEVAGGAAAVTLPDEGAAQGAARFSPSGDGGILASGPGGGQAEAVYATGWIGGSAAPVTGRSGYPDVKGRHEGGADFLLVDGHVKWLSPERVFAGNYGRITDAEFAQYEAHFLEQNYSGE